MQNCGRSMCVDMDKLDGKRTDHLKLSQFHVCICSSLFALAKPFWEEREKCAPWHVYLYVYVGLSIVVRLQCKVVVAKWWPCWYFRTVFKIMVPPHKPRIGLQPSFSRLFHTLVYSMRYFRCTNYTFVHNRCTLYIHSPEHAMCTRRFPKSRKLQNSV